MVTSLKYMLKASSKTLINYINSRLTATATILHPASTMVFMHKLVGIDCGI